MRCVFLLALYPALILAIFWLLAFLISSMIMHQPTEGVYGTWVLINSANGIFYEYWPIITSGVAIWFTIAWFMHGRMIRAMSQSHPVSREEEPELYNLLENLSIAQGMTMPRLEIIETHARNAFASGIHKGNYTVTVTRGLMNSLSKDELEAVLAHELTHIINNDVRLLIVTIIFAGLFGTLAQVAWRSFIRNSFRFSRDRKGSGPLMLVIAAILGLGYLISLLMRFALSRHREFMADAGAIEMTKNPTAMMSALMRISGRDRMPNMNDDIAMMCIENHKSFLGMFATHPPIDQRISVISAYTATPVPDHASLPPIEKEKSFGHNTKNGKASKNPWVILDRKR